MASDSHGVGGMACVRFVTAEFCNASDEFCSRSIVVSTSVDVGGSGATAAVAANTLPGRIDFLVCCPIVSLPSGTSFWFRWNLPLMGHSSVTYSGGEDEEGRGAGATVIQNCSRTGETVILGASPW